MKEKILKYCLPGFYLIGILGVIISGVDYYNEIQKEKARLLKINNILEVEEIGEQVKLELNSQNKNQDVVFEVDNPNVVDVNENGDLLSVGEGITTITVTNTDITKTQTFVVGVGDEAINKLKDNKEKIEQLIEENEILLPQNNNKQEEKDNSKDKPTVNENNNSSNNNQSNQTNNQSNQTNNSSNESNKNQTNNPPEEVKPQQKNIKVTNIKLNKSSLTLKYNESAKLTATISPANATNKNVTWKSSNSKLVTVDSNGNIKVVGNKNAKAVITVTSKDGSYKASATINVKAVTNTVKVTGVKINEGNNNTVYLNQNPTIKLTATVYPTNATNKNITWRSSNTNVATIDNNGLITIKGLGNATITVTTNDSSYKATYTLTVKEKAIVVITASAGERMQDYFKEYKSNKGNYYYSNGSSRSSANKKTGNPGNGTLMYVYYSGKGFEYQYGDGLSKAKNIINNKYANVKNYVELSVFFTLTGNSVKSYTCNDIETNKNGLYTNTAQKYNSAIQSIINAGYSNTKGFVISHSPLNTKQAINELKKSGFAFSHKPEACKSGYRSAWKYWISNRQMESILKNRSYSNLTFVDNYSNFVILNNESKRTFTWLRDYYRTTDGLHWDERTTKDYMQLAFDTAGM